MYPKLKEEDVIFVKKCKQEDIKEGTIISFKRNNETITHRVVKIKKGENGFVYITKGDNNEIIDNFETSFDQIYGKVIFKIGKIGNFVKYVQNIKGMVNVIIIIVVIYFFVNMKDKRKNSRRITRKKYEIKKLRENYK